jgi:hypothetical protein
MVNRKNTFNTARRAALIVLTFVATLGFSQTSITTYTLDTPVSNQVIINSCNNDTVTLSGTMHFEYHFQTDPSGNTNFFIHSTSNLNGTGAPSNASYVGKDSTDYHTITKQAQASDFTDIQKIKLVAQGPTPNMTLRLQVHVLVDTQGNIKIDKNSFTVKCN